MKKFLIAVFLLCSVSLGYAAFSRTLVATDDFNRANGALGANWASTNTNACSGVVVNTNHAQASHDAGIVNACTERWIGAGTFTDDQYSQITITANMSSAVNDHLGVSCRNSADIDATGYNASDRYEFNVRRNTSGSAQTTAIVKIVNGARSTLTTAAVLWIATDVISIECTGSTTTLIEGFKNGVVQMSISDSSTPLTTGQPGIFSGTPGATMDDWSAGSLTTAVFTTGRRRVSSQ